MTETRTIVAKVIEQDLLGPDVLLARDEPKAPEGYEQVLEGVGVTPSRLSDRRPDGRWKHIQSVGSAAADEFAAAYQSECRPPARRAAKQERPRSPEGC